MKRWLVITWLLVTPLSLIAEPAKFVQLVTGADCSQKVCVDALYALDANGQVWIFINGFWYPLSMERGTIDHIMR